MEVTKTMKKGPLASINSPPKSLNDIERPGQNFYFTPQVKKKPGSLAYLDTSNNDSKDYKVFSSIQCLPYINTKKKKSKNSLKIKKLK